MPRDNADSDEDDNGLLLNYDTYATSSSSSIIVPVELGRLFVHLQTVNANVGRVWLQRAADGARVEATGEGRQLVYFDIPHERRVVPPTSANDEWLIARTETYLLYDGNGAPLLMIEPCRAQRVRFPPR